MYNEGDVVCFDVTQAKPFPGALPLPAGSKSIKGICRHIDGDTIDLEIEARSDETGQSSWMRYTVPHDAAKPLGPSGTCSDT